MNSVQRETESFFSALEELFQICIRPEEKSLFSETLLRCWLFPPYLSLESAKKASSELSFPLQIGAQNAHWEKQGAFTGEISGPMLKELKLSRVIIGHSERRQYFGETDETVRKRTESLLEQGFQVILCIGENKHERESGKTKEVITRQLFGAIPEASKGAAPFLNGQLILAYEPVWAIGTGLTATPEQAEESHQWIRKVLNTRFGENAANQTPILYGGSVTPDTIDSLLNCANIDGALVGGASLKPDSFMSLIKSSVMALK